MVAALHDSGAPWAWQGPAGAPAAWDVAHGPSDLDVWWSPTPDQKSQVLAALGDLAPYAVVAESTDSRRLQHLSLAFEVAGDLAVIDFTEGDLRVGAVLLVPAADVTVGDGEPGDGGQPGIDHEAESPALTGVAGAADLLVRPLLRGKVPPAARLDQARGCWRQASPQQRDEASARWQRQIGEEADTIAEVLGGATPDDYLARRVRNRLLRRTLAPSGLRAAWAQRWSVAPAGRAAGPLELRTRGVVVALVGTDGSGKSTVARQLAERLEALGYDTSEAYFGMARGNLPGVGLARKVLGIKPEPDRTAEATTAASAEAPAAATATAAPPAPDDSDDSEELAYPLVRRVAAWFYAAEYAWRYARHVAPGVRRRDVVICDRYVYDLRDSPWPGSPAARFAQRIVPAPDVLVLPDAPPEVIHARKPERSLAGQAAQQRAFRALLAEQPARCAELILDTSGADPDAVAPVVAAVVEASHHPRRSPRR